MLAADTSQFVSVEVRDENGAAVPNVTVQLSATGAELSSVGDATGSLELQTNDFGRASATLSGEPGEVVLRASAGGVSESIRLTLHGAPVSLSLIALREVVNLGDAPFAAPAGTLVAILLDDGGRPVPGVRVEFSTDNEGVAVRHEDDSESVITDGTGRARGHVSAADAETPGLVTVSATAADELVDSATVGVVGPADELLVSVRSQSVGRFQITALVVDAEGNAVPTGYHVDWSTIGLAAGAEALFEPARSAVRDGAAQTVLRIALGDASGVLVRAELVEAPDVAVAVALPSSGSDEGTALSSGLNLVLWAGETAAPVSAVVAAIEGLLVAAWRLDGVLGWQSYVPGAAARSSDYAVNPGDRLYLYLAAPAALEGVERAP